MSQFNGAQVPAPLHASPHGILTPSIQVRLVVGIHDKGPDWTRIQVPTGVKVMDERTTPARGKPQGGSASDIPER